jgi:SAM-dependent methyltransferase
VTDSEEWARYYAVTAERPAWQTVRVAIERFRAEDEAASLAASPAASPAAPPRRRFAVDLGCGAGRDARELLRAGWRVLAIDREAAAKEAIEAATEPDLRPNLEVRLADLAGVEVPPCDLVNASLSLPFLAHDAFEATWQRVLAAIRPGARLSAMLFGDGDESASDPDMTCLPPERLEADLADFQIELWAAKEEDGQTALGEPHHLHLIEIVARRIR